MDSLIAVITWISLIFAAGFCEGGNFIAAVASVAVLGTMTVLLNRRESRNGKRSSGKVAKRDDRCA